VAELVILATGVLGADASQAAYFRGFLADELTHVVMELAHSRARLRECLERDQVVGLRGMARARRAVRDSEAKQRELERMLAALDRRFSALWAREG
jgi:hypothetical protein